MSKERITFFDALKGFSIILVVFCHNFLLSGETIVGNIFMSLAWAAVPCFFLVTGGLMHRSEQFVLKKYIERILKIYLVLVIWKLLFLCFFMLFNDITLTISGTIKYLFFMGDIPNVVTGQLWFMYAYLQALLLYPITHFLYFNGKIGKKLLLYLALILWTTSIFSTVVSSLGIHILDSFWGLVPFSGFKNMLFYFITGIFLYSYREKIQQFLSGRKWRMVIPWILLILGTFGVMWIKYSTTGSFRWNGRYLENGYNRFSTMLMAIGFYLLFQMELFSKFNKVLSIVGKYTMGIFYLHYPVLVVYNKVWNKLIENYSDYYSFGLNFIQTIIVVMICLGITAIARKIPFVKHLFL